MKSLTPIETLHLHPRAYHALIDNGVNFVEHLLLYDLEDLMNLPGMGKGLARAVQENLGTRGKQLATFVHCRERRQKEFELKYGHMITRLLPNFPRLP